MLLTKLLHVAKHETLVTICIMLKGQDIVLLSALLEDHSGEWTVRSLAEPLSLDPATVHRSLSRLAAARLINRATGKADRPLAEEFLLHGFKFVFPIKQGGETIGIPTAWAAPPLSDLVSEGKSVPPVWPDPLGEVRGIAVNPLHPKVPDIARRDPRLRQFLALLDALRLGDARARSLAADEIRERLRSRPGAIVRA